MFNLETAKPLDKTFERKSTGVVREQKFEFKYRSTNGKGTFTMSNKSWSELNLDSNDKALAVLRNYDESGEVTAVAFQVVDAESDDAKFYKKSKRGDKHQSFNSPIFERELIQAGVVNEVAEDDKANQYISLTQMDEDDTVYVLASDSRDKSEIEAYGSSDEDEVEAEEADYEV